MQCPSLIRGDSNLLEDFPVGWTGTSGLLVTLQSFVLGPLFVVPEERLEREASKHVVGRYRVRLIGRYRGEGN